jgi:hypothetical protein
MRIKPGPHTNSKFPVSIFNDVIGPVMRGPSDLKTVDQPIYDIVSSKVNNIDPLFFKKPKA